MLDSSPSQFLIIFRIFVRFFCFYVVDRLRSERCFFPPVTISSKKSPLSATIRRQPLDKLRRPRMRIRPHHAPVHRKRLHLRIHTLLADLHITIRIERLHHTVDLPLRTRRHLHIPELPHTLHLRTTPKQPDRQRISKSAPLQPQPNNNPCQCQCRPLQHPTTSSKKPDTPHAYDNTSS